MERNSSQLKPASPKFCPACSQRLATVEVTGAIGRFKVQCAPCAAAAYREQDRAARQMRREAALDRNVEIRRRSMLAEF